MSYDHEEVAQRRKREHLIVMSILMLAIGFAVIGIAVRILLAFN